MTFTFWHVSGFRLHNTVIVYNEFFERLKNASTAALTHALTTHSLLLPNQKIMKKPTTQIKA